MKFIDYKYKYIFPTNLVLGIALHVSENNRIRPRIFLKKGQNIMNFTKYDDYNIINHRLGYPLIAVYMTNIEVESEIDYDPESDLDIQETVS